MLKEKEILKYTQKAHGCECKLTFFRLSLPFLPSRRLFGTHTHNDTHTS